MTLTHDKINKLLRELKENECTLEQQNQIIQDAEEKINRLREGISEIKNDLLHNLLSQYNSNLL